MAYWLSLAPERSPTIILPTIDFGALIQRREEMANNELLVARTPDDQAKYCALQWELEETGITLQETMLERFKSLGGRVLRAVLLPDEYPANITSDNDQKPVVHYDLWLRLSKEGPDFAAGEKALSLLEGRDPSREVYCFKRTPTQSVPPIPRDNEFPYEHAHVFTTATMPVGGIIVIEDPLR